MDMALDDEEPTPQVQLFDGVYRVINGSENTDGSNNFKSNKQGREE